MASIMISSFSIISVKDNGLLMPVLVSWVKNETGSVIMCWGSGMVKTLVISLKMKLKIILGACS